MRCLIWMCLLGRKGTSCVYNRRMDAYEGKSAYRDTITTSGYALAKGITLNSASRALKRLAEQGMAVKTAKARWVVLKSPHETAATATLLHRSERLDGFYGETPRRISHKTALSMSGIPLLSGLDVASPMRVSSRYAAKFGITHRREHASTLKIAAVEIDARTWLSEPARALLEYAQAAPDIDADEVLQTCAVYWEAEHGAEEIVALGSEMGWRAGMRRLASVVANLAKHGQAEPVMEDFLSRVPSLNSGDRWVDLVPRLRKIGYAETAWSDADRRIRWHSHPEEVLENLMY